MSPVWILLLFYFWAVNSSRYFSLCLYTSFLFYFIAIPLPLLLCFYFAVSHSLSLPLPSRMGCIPLLIGLLSSLRSLLRIMFFLPYAHYVAVFVSSAFAFARVFCFLFIFYLFIVSSVSLPGRRCPLLASLLSVFFCLLFLLLSARVPGSI